MRRAYKWIFTYLAAILFLLCGSFLPEEPLKSKAMVVAFGIDYNEDALDVSLQILTSGTEESGTDTRTVQSTGSTIGECVYTISERTGLAVTLTHCNVLLLGENLLNSPHVYAVMNYLVTNAYLSDNACVFGCEGSPRDILSSKVAFGENAGLFIREIVGLYDSYGDVCAKTLRQYVVDYHRLGNCNVIPYVTRFVADSQIPSSSDLLLDQTQDCLFRLNSVVVLVKNTFIGVYPQEDALALNLLLRKIDKGQLNGTGDNGEKIAWYILKNSCKLTYDLPEKKVTAVLKISLLLKDVLDYSETDAFIDRTEVTDDEITRSCAVLADSIQTFYKEMQTRNADVFGLQEGFYCRYPRERLPTLQEIRLEIAVTPVMQ